MTLMRKSLGLLACSVLLMAGCSSGGSRHEAQDNPSGNRFVAEVDFPLVSADLEANLAESMTTSDVRRLAATLADLDGVVASEVDYGARTVRVTLEPEVTEAERADVEQRVRTASRTPAG
ncbi:MAG: hypothetical protein ACRD0C_11710 [Acidimicrobiia bacterium]